MMYHHIEEKMKSRSYKFNNSEVKIIFGNILDSLASVIVSSDDSEISMGGGVSGSILEAGGQVVQDDAQRKLPVDLGDVVVSTSGNLQYQKYIFHCITIDVDFMYGRNKDKYGDVGDLNKFIIERSIDRCFKLMQVLEVDSIAFPCIGAGVARIPFEEMAELMAASFAKNLCETNKSYNIEFYVFDLYGIYNSDEYIKMFECFAAQSALSNLHMEKNLLEIGSNLGNVPESIRKSVNENPDVFISYSRRDGEIAKFLCDFLGDHGIGYWIDKEGIFCGENYKEVIVDAIDKSKALIFLSSAHSNESVNVAREIAYAIGTKKTVLPLMLDNAPFYKSLKLDLADLDQIDFSNRKEACKKLLHSIELAEKRS